MDKHLHQFPGADQPPREAQAPAGEDKQGVDKDPGEEQGHGEQVTDKDLKGKKVDRDPTDPQDAPA